MKNIVFGSEEIEIIENEWIALSDGSRMAARIWLPAGARERPVPAILEYIPYRKRDTKRIRDDINHQYLSANGYACVRLDIRGSGDSDGVIQDQYLEQEISDGIEAIAWIAEQSWCDGNVGMMGISWGGFNSLQIAARRPPQLKAIVTVCASDDMYADNMHYMGGCLLTDNLVESTTMFSINSSPPDPRIVGERWREMWLERLEGSGLWLETWLKHQKRDDYWNFGSVCANYDAIQCPVFTAGGWADGFTNAIFRLMTHLNVPRIALIGPWGHNYPHLGKPGPQIGFLQEVVRWFDYWMKEKQTGIMDEPMLRVWLQNSVKPDTQFTFRPGRWIGEERWPSSNIEQRELKLWRRQLLLDEPHGEIEPHIMTLQSPLSVGLFAGKWLSYATGSDMAYDQREEDGGALFFESAPLEDDFDILGEPELEMHVSSDKPVAMVCARLSDVFPDDTVSRVTYGLLNLTYRENDKNPEPLIPGKKYTIRVKLNHIGQRFSKGHRIRLSLSTSYWPLAWPAPETPRLTLYFPDTKLYLPVRKDSASSPEIDFLPSVGGTPCKITRLRERENRWTIKRDLADDLAEQHVINDAGHYRIEEIDLELASKAEALFSYRFNDVDTVQAETRTERLFQRDDWSIKTVSRTLLTSSKTHFHISAELFGYEGDQEVFSKFWDSRIPRNLL